MTVIYTGIGIYIDIQIYKHSMNYFQQNMQWLNKKSMVMVVVPVLDAES